MKMMSALLTALKHDFILPNCLPSQSMTRVRERENTQGYFTKATTSTSPSSNHLHGNYSAISLAM